MVCVFGLTIIAGVSGLSDSDSVILIQSALVIAGLSTFLQLFPIGKKGGFHLGSGLPVIMGVSFAYLPSMQAIAGDFGLPAIFGAQIVGGDGVDKRIDVLATAIRAKMTALELTELDLSYAPPYSSAKDPVNMAGFMIEDLESEKVRQFHWNEVEDLPCDGSATLLDVRTEGEYRRGHLNGFRNIPLDDLREHLDELDQGKPVYVNCQTGLRSYLACRLLTQYGFTCANLSGGYSFYRVVTKEQQTARSAYPCGMEKL